MASTTPSRPSLSKKSPFSTSRPSLESSSIFGRFQEAALALLPQRRASPTKTRSASTTTTTTLPAKRSFPFTALSPSRHKPPLSSPAAVQGVQSVPLGNKALPPQKPLPTTPPPLPPKSAPVSRAVTPSYALGTQSTAARGAPALPQVSQSLRSSRPTIPFASSSNLMKPTAASSARSRPAVPMAISPSTSTTRPPTHARTLSKSRPEPSTPSSPIGSENKTPTLISSMTNRLRASPSPNPDPKRETPELKISSPTQLRPRLPNKTPISPPPSAFAMKSTATAPASSRSLPRKRSKTFPDPSEPNAPVPPSASPSQNSSRPMQTANRILEAFEPSPRMNESPEPFSPTKSRSKSTSPTPIRPARPIRASTENAFMSIPSQSKTSASNRIIPSAASIEASATRVRPALPGPSRTAPSSTRSATLVSSGSGHSSRPSFDQSLPPPPRKPLSPTVASISGINAQTRRRPNLRPIQTTPIDAREVSSPITPMIVKAPSPVTPETQPSSASPKTPATYVEPSSYVTSDEESRPRRRAPFKGLFGRKRPDSIVSSSTAATISGTSNGSLAFGVGRMPPPSAMMARQPRAPSTFGGVAEEDETLPYNLQMRRGIRRVAEIPYPVSFEELALQGEKHTHELLSLVRLQKAYHFTPMDNFSKLKNILDIGCGRGYWLMDAAKECKHANLVGFDIADVFMSTDDMRIKRGLNESQSSRIKFVQGNFFNALPFPSDQFDYIRLAFLELAIPESKWVPLLKEAWRVLKAGGHIEVVIESQLFPTVWTYDKLPVQEELEEEFREMLATREIPEVTNIGEKMFFDAFARVQTHQHVSVCIAPRSLGRNSAEGMASPRNFGSMRSVHNNPWSSEPAVPTGMISPTPFGRPSLDRSGSSMDILPPSGQLVTSKTCSVPGIVISHETFVPVSEDTLYTYASHGAMILNATRLAAFSDKYPDASLDNYEREWRAHVERYWQYEKTNRDRLGFRQNQFDDDEDDMPVIPAGARWKWARCDEDLERPLEIRRFRAWSLSKPIGSR